MKKTPWGIVSAWKQSRPSQKIAFIISIVGITLAVLTLPASWLQFRTKITPRTIVRPDLIKEGDNSFRVYRYADAYESYRAAAKQLDTAIQFENESPSRSVSTLARYHNSKAFIEARIQLALIAYDVSRPEGPRLQNGNAGQH